MFFLSEQNRERGKTVAEWMIWDQSGPREMTEDEVASFLLALIESETSD